MKTRSGLTIKLSREGLGMTQKQLADKLGVSNLFISRVEGGLCLISGRLVKKMAKHIKVNTDTFVKEYLQDRMDKILASLK